MPVSWDLDHELSVLCINSPAQDKDQDRIAWIPDLRVAAVCDGVTTSPHSGRAAEIATQFGRRLFFGDIAEGIAAIASALIVERGKAKEAPLVFPPEMTPGLCEEIAQVARERLESSCQTTFVSIALTQGDDSLLIELVRCGDSAFFAFSMYGDLIYSSPVTAIATTNSTRSCVTRVLPDHGITGQWVTAQLSLPLASDLILCTDGAYECFDAPADMLNWLWEHERQLVEDEPGETLLAELHTSRQRRAGDDDISVIWISPRMPHHASYNHRSQGQEVKK